MMFLKKIFVFITVIILVLPVFAFGDLVDLTTGNKKGTANGALFYNYLPDGRSITSWNSFLEIQSNGTEQGINIDSTLYYNTKYADLMQLNDIPMFNIDGITYREFLLDINEAGKGKSYLSLDQLNIYLLPNLITNPSDLPSTPNLHAWFKQLD